MTLSERARDIIRDDPALAAEIARLALQPVAGLTYRQRQVLDFIEEFIEDHGGVSPSYKQISEAVGLNSCSGVQRIIVGLEERGYIRVLPGKARSITIISNPYSVGAQSDHGAG